MCWCVAACYLCCVNTGAKTDLILVTLIGGRWHNLDTHWTSLVLFPQLKCGMLIIEFLIGREIFDMPSCDYLCYEKAMQANDPRRLDSCQNQWNCNLKWNTCGPCLPHCPSVSTNISWKPVLGLHPLTYTELWIHRQVSKYMLMRRESWYKVRHGHAHFIGSRCFVYLIMTFLACANEAALSHLIILVVMQPLRFHTSEAPFSILRSLVLLRWPFPVIMLRHIIFKTKWRG